MGSLACAVGVDSEDGSIFLSFFVAFYHEYLETVSDFLLELTGIRVFSVDGRCMFLSAACVAELDWFDNSHVLGPLSAG